MENVTIIEKKNGLYIYKWLDLLKSFLAKNGEIYIFDKVKY